MADPYPNVDEFGRGSCTCSGTMTGCAVCTCANMLLRYRKPIPRLSDGTPDMRTLGRRMGARHRAVQPTSRHGRSLEGLCTGGTNWCTYCIYLELRAHGLPAYHRQLAWVAIVAQLELKHAMAIAGMYNRIPIVSESSYTSTVPARGRSDAGFGDAHMMTGWDVAAKYADGSPRVFNVSDPDFGSPSRPVVPPHSQIGQLALHSFWASLGWSVCYIAAAPPATAQVIPWWGSDVDANIRKAYSAKAVGNKLHQVGVAHYGKAINEVDLEAGLKKRGIDYGSSVQLIDVRALMKPGTGS